MLSTLFAVFIGGGIGSILRWLISMRLNPLSINLPVGTLIVNLSGAFIIGLALAFFTRLPHVDPALKLLITTGFCGGLTTFSTFSVEVISLLQEGKLAWAAATILANSVGSLVMTALAFVLVNTLSAH